MNSSMTRETSQSGKNVQPLLQKKHTFLSLEKRLEVIRKLEEGQTTIKSVADMYAVSKTTIREIIKNKNEYKQIDQDLEAKNPKRKLKRSSSFNDSALQQILYSWYNQERLGGIPVSGKLLQEKALEVSKVMGDTEFKASNGWLQRFKTRFGIRQISLQGEKLSADLEAATVFSLELQDYITSEGINLEHIYNADEMGLVWKSLPNKTHASWEKNSASAFKECKERVTVMACSNAAGTHRIPLLVIGKTQKPRCFNGLEVLPAHYMAQKNSWMDSNLFLKWYSDIFIPEIKSTMKDQNEKFVLLLDNCPCHLSEEKLNAVDDCCIVKFFPPNVTSLVQPMDQGVIAAFKRKYRELYLKKFIYAFSEENKDHKVFLSEWNLLHCIQAVSEAWESLSCDTLKNTWKPLFGDSFEKIPENVKDLNNLMNFILDDSFNEAETVEWLECDKDDQGWPLQSIQDLVRTFHGNSTETEDDHINDENNDCDIDERTDDVISSPVTAEMAYAGANKLYDWLSSQCDTDIKDLTLIGKLKRSVLDAVICNQIQKKTLH